MSPLGLEALAARLAAAAHTYVQYVHACSAELRLVPPKHVIIHAKNLINLKERVVSMMPLFLLLSI